MPTEIVISNIFSENIITLNVKSLWFILISFHSDVFDEELYKKTLEGDFERRLEIETEKREMQASNGNDNKPKCPTCGSTNVRHIGGVERAVSVIGLGLFSGKIGKNHECLNCKARWLG